jgi:formylglycine-generating enzyme required for sulfatase activity
MLAAFVFWPTGPIAQQRSAGAGPLPSSGKELVAVMEFAAVSATRDELAAITDRLQDALLKQGKFTLVDRSQIETLLKEQAFQQSGCTSQECAVRVGKVLGVKKIISGRVSKINDNVWQISAQLLDVETAETLRAEAISHRGDILSLLDQAVVALASRLAGATAASSSTGAGFAASQSPVADVPKLGNIWREAVTGMEFVWVPGGRFEMGCHSNAGQCFDDERPPGYVRVNGFWLGKTEVTQRQWTKVMNSNPSYSSKADDLPVEQVSWEDSQEFTNRLNAGSGTAKFALPTEAQWEYACRSEGKLVTYGTRTGELSEELANFGTGMFGAGTESKPAGSYPPNELGLFNMSGNVWEWVQDVYSTDAYRRLGVDNPIYTGVSSRNSSTNHVIRGGAWNTRAVSLRCSHRQSRPATFRDLSIGLRVAMSQ